MKAKLSFVILISVFNFSCSNAQYEKPKSNGGDTTGIKNNLPSTAPSGKVIPSQIKDEGKINPVKHN